MESVKYLLDALRFYVCRKNRRHYGTLKTSVISGGEDHTMLDYANWYYGAEDDEEDTVDYDITYFFDDSAKPGTYVITSYEGCETGGLGAQYPTVDTIKRCAVMQDFSGDSYEKINRMWIDVRCFNIFEVWNE